MPKIISTTAQINEHNKNYIGWLKRHLANESNHNIVAWLAQKPSHIVTKYEAYVINGNTFYTKGRDERTTYQNSSIRIECLTADVVPKKEVYYGTIIEIWELDYVKIMVALFKCRSVALGHVKVDEYGKTYVNLDKMAYIKNHSFLPAKLHRFSMFQTHCIRISMWLCLGRG